MTTCPVVFVDGLDGSGKSTLAQGIRDRLAAAGLHPILLAIDDFRQPLDWTQTAVAEATLYHDLYFNLPALDQVLARILAGARSVEVPVFNENADAMNRLQPVPADPFVLVEGVFSQRLAMASAAALVFVDCSWDEARRRILARDQARGRSAEDVCHRIENRYFPAQRHYQESHAPRQRAHWIVDHEKQGAPYVQRSPQPLCAPGLTAAQTQTLHAALLSL